MMMMLQQENPFCFCLLARNRQTRCCH